MLERNSDQASGQLTVRPPKGFTTNPQEVTFLLKSWNGAAFLKIKIANKFCPQIQAREKNTPIHLLCQISAIKQCHPHKYIVSLRAFDFKLLDEVLNLYCSVLEFGFEVTNLKNIS